MPTVSCLRWSQLSAQLRKCERSGSLNAEVVAAVLLRSAVMSALGRLAHGAKKELMEALLGSVGYLSDQNLGDGKWGGEEACVLPD